MTEISSSDNEELVSRVYTRALADRHEGRESTPADLMVYHIEMLSQEVNSGASFEQYFRWASIDEIAEAAERLESLGLRDVARIVRHATDIAFPQGLPGTDEDKDEHTDWTEDQEASLAAAAGEFEKFNGQIINALAAFYRNATPQA